MDPENKLKILLVDDDKNIRQTLQVSLLALGAVVTACPHAEAALAALKKDQFDFVLTDFRMGAQSGLDLVRATRKIDPLLILAVMTAFASFDNAVEAIKEGAYDYLPKPFTQAQLRHLIERVKEILRLRRENEQLKRQVSRRDFFVGQTSTAMLRLQELVGKIADTDATILMTGESGTGKSELARVIHERSNRRSQPFVTVNCTSLAESLIESELFGHVKGAFTGASQDRKGKLELADHGTVFLDEIGDLSPGGQAKLLRFLQERVIEKVGSSTPVPIDARVIAATNKGLVEAVKEGKFREDLYYRLNVFECTLVPLRYRREDLPVLIDRMSHELSLSTGKAAPIFTPAVIERLSTYPWPGNLRELRNFIERTLHLNAGREVTLGDLPDSVLRPATALQTERTAFLSTLEDLERAHIEKVLSYEKNQERAAQILGITPVTLWRKRKQYGLP